MHYNYHRYYDPNTGRYLTPDPIGLTGGVNLFSYANLNPVNAIDPLGLEVLDADFGFPDSGNFAHYPIERKYHPHPPLFGPVLDQAHHLELQISWSMVYPIIFVSNLPSGELPSPLYPAFLPPLTDENGIRLKYEDVPWWYWIPIEFPETDCQPE